MDELNLADATFIVATPDRVAGQVLDRALWGAWWPGLQVGEIVDRGIVGARWQVSGEVTGTAELWLEPVLDGVVLHWFLRGRCHGRSAATTEDRYRRRWKRQVFRLKDRLEAGRAPGVKPDGVAAED